MSYATKHRHELAEALAAAPPGSEKEERASTALDDHRTHYAKKPPHHPAPVRIMHGEQLAAVVTSHHGEVSIRPEPGWKLIEATINVTMRRAKNQPAKKPPPPRTDEQTAGYLRVIKGEPTP